MSLFSVRKRFFEKRPNDIAYITKNEVLGKYICYLCDYTKNENTNVVIDDNLREKIKVNANGKNGDYFNIVLDYLGRSDLSSDILSSISECYWEYLSGKFKVDSIDDACNMLNIFCTQNNLGKNISNKSKIVAFVIDENGNLDQNAIFNMDICFKKSKVGKKMCVIEETFTEPDYRNCGIHGDAIKFLEALLANKNIYNLVGKSQDCDVYDESGIKTLNEHYTKLGFKLMTTKDGRNYITKTIDQYNELPISKDDCFKE